MLKYEPSHNNIEGMMPKVALTTVIQQEDFENSMDLDPFSLFINAIRADQTRRKYQARLNTFFNYISIPNTNLEERCKIFLNNCHVGSGGNTRYATNCVFRFIVHLKERMNKKEIVVSTIYNYLKPIKLFCEMNDIEIKWKKITLGLPKEKKYAEDRAPTIEEIQKILEYPDRRIKVIILTMISCGMRLGAWNDLRYKHIQPVKNTEGEVVAAKIIIYAGSDEQYTAFVTKETYQSIEEWIDYRRKSGEQITGDSWLLRNLWDVTTPSGGPRGLVSVPKKLKDTGVKSLVERALRAQGLRTKLEEGKKRYEFATDHGFRKFFKTRCEIAGMRSLTVEYLLNHSTGITDSYFRPTENELLQDYLKVSDLLQIDKQGKLQKELHQYQQRNQEESYIIKGKIQEKDKEVEELKKQDKIKEEALIKLSDQVMILMKEMQGIKNNSK